MDTSVRDKIIEHLKGKWKDAKCPMCNEAIWEVVSTIYSPPQFAKGGVVLGGEVIPTVPVVCTNCGFTAWVNAMVAGILDQKEDAQ